MISTNEAIQAIFVVIGEGRIKQSDVFFILAEKYATARKFLDQHLPEKLPLALPALIKTGAIDGPYDCDELILYASYRKRGVYFGDMYVFLAEMERTLHQKIKSRLIKEYGPLDTGWWKKGVPVGVRAKCAEAREYDGEFLAHSYSYTTIIDLKKILEIEWKIFHSHLPQSVVKNRKAFFGDLNRLNGIRNQVMHPVREQPPTEEDFGFVREMHKKLIASHWR